MTVLAVGRDPVGLTLTIRPLAVPDPKHLPSADQLASMPAVALFLARARAVASN
jgi:hypothetical protein